MKFIVTSTLLYSRLQSISRVLNSKNTLPILDSFLFDLKEGTLTMTASDSETTLVTSMEVNESDGDIRFALTAKQLLESLKEMPDMPLTFEVDLTTRSVCMKYLNGKSNMVAQNADEYPQPIKLGENAEQLTIPSDALLYGVTRALFATADDELRPIMGGVYFDITAQDVTMVASDGHKLVRNRSFSGKGTGRSAFALPKKPALQLKSLLPKEEGDVEVRFDERAAIFQMENYLMICRLIEGRYPNYNSVIPKDNPYHATVDRQALLGALRRVAIFSSESTNLVKLCLDTDKIIVSAQDIDFSTSAEEFLTCSYDGTPLRIGFRSDFLIDILNSIADDEVTLELGDASRAGIFYPAEQQENEDLLLLLMPIMLND